jgi:hypothetical protein
LLPQPSLFFLLPTPPLFLHFLLVSLFSLYYCPLSLSPFYYHFLFHLILYLLFSCFSTPSLPHPSLFSRSSFFSSYSTPFLPHLLFPSVSWRSLLCVQSLKEIVTQWQEIPNPFCSPKALPCSQEPADVCITSMWCSLHCSTIALPSIPKSSKTSSLTFYGQDFEHIVFLMLNKFAVNPIPSLISS